MATITVKNIPPDLYEQLKRSAEANRRSLNSEIIVCIERAVQVHTVIPDELLAEARRLREITRAYAITEAEFDRAKAVGRP